MSVCATRGPPAAGMGINRITANFRRARCDGAFRASDAEAVEMVGRAGRPGVCAHVSVYTCMLGGPAGGQSARRTAALTSSPRPAGPCRAQAHYLLRHDGLFVGSSAAVNCVGAVKAARALGPGHTIVTLLCDGGHRHLSKFHNAEYLESFGLTPRHQGRGLEFVQ